MADEKKPPPRLSPETVELCRKRAGNLLEKRPKDPRGCSNCKWIIESLAPDGTLRPWPPGAEGQEIVVPVEGHVKHIELEKRP